ncbi:hypothetical protein GCM10011491_31210 [Brucella endophytica]|uniref:Uncharacterized protein n=1 Tax=Brucella endophytica TaxID=1963359 RepID=A0A916SHP5_9HYPH|nr:hypothetical protein [Brucella endophytica]GGB00778.1 hypothetical protein GCM10011491_31210 [Brucella endophytica]
MKITLKKDMDKERKAARAHLDELFAPRIEAALGPKAALYAVKYAAALAGCGGWSTPLVPHAAEAAIIIEKHHEMHKGLALIEAERQALQAEIDSADNCIQLQAILQRV